MKLIYNSDSLKHHGVKGQRWGIRRYQPYPDGTNKGKELGKARKTRQEKMRELAEKELGRKITSYDFGGKITKKRNKSCEKI